MTNHQEILDSSGRQSWIAALFVETGGCYFGLLDVDPWDITRDARKYAGPWPVVAHPPCQLWGRFAAINYKRWGGGHNLPGNDGGCFASALASVNRWGGVLEHPAETKAWAEFGLLRPGKNGWIRSGPGKNGWIRSGKGKGWVCEVWQSAYGHPCRKSTWLYYVGAQPPADMRWDRVPGTHQIGFHDQRGKDRNKPTVSGKKASRTPPAFRDALIRLAQQSGEVGK